MLQLLFSHSLTALNLLPILKHSIQWKVIYYLREKSFSVFIKRYDFNFPTRTFVTQTLCKEPKFS